MTTTLSSPTAQSPPASLTGRIKASRFGRGELGFLPVVVALVVIAIVFYWANPVFLTPRNLSNLALQLGVLGVMTLGLNLVLLIGEIDLSAGSLSGMCAVVMVLLSSAGAPAIVALGAAILLGAVIGCLQGLVIVIVRAPSFIVTLTGLLVWQGVQHLLIGYQIGEVELDDPIITGIASTYLPTWLSVLLVAIVGAGAIVYAIRNWPSADARRASRVVLRAAIYPVLAAAVTVVLSRYFGIPFLLVMLVVLAIVLTLMTEASPFGVHIFAVGGNSEATRRAGINVAALRVVVFTLCSALAALSGIVAASRQYAADSNTGGGDLVLDAIAAAVIGGTSLFGGRGRVMGGLLGALVIGSVTNGLDLLGQSADVKTIITGFILLAAVTVDMLARRRRLRSGAAGA